MKRALIINFLIILPTINAQKCQISSTYPSRLIDRPTQSQCSDVRCYNLTPTEIQKSIKWVNSPSRNPDKYTLYNLKATGYYWESACGVTNCNIYPSSISFDNMPPSETSDFLKLGI